MKRKIFTTAITAILGVSLLSACGTNYKVTFSDYWKQSKTQSVINHVSEECEYAISFTKGGNSSYTMQYQNGSYKTTFKSYLDADGENILYSYTTEMSVQVQYTVGDKTSEWLNDSVQSTVVFQSSKNGLTPISSTNHTISHSPKSITASTLESAYMKYDMTATTTYDPENCESATTVVTNNLKQENNTEEKTFTIKHNTYNYLDNEQLFFATRCLDSASNASYRFQVYSPYTKSTQKIDVKFGAEATSDFTFAIGTESASRKIAYYPTTVKLNAKNNNTGTPKTLWIAKTNDPLNNTYRNVILRQEIPVSFNLGTIVMTLKTVTFA